MTAAGRTDGRRWAHLCCRDKRGRAVGAGQHRSQSDALCIEFETSKEGGLSPLRVCTMHPLAPADTDYLWGIKISHHVRLTSAGSVLSSLWLQKEQLKKLHFEVRTRMRNWQGSTEGKSNSKGRLSYSMRGTLPAAQTESKYRRFDTAASVLVL